MKNNCFFLILLALLLHTATASLRTVYQQAAATPYKRLNATDTVILLVDHQTGLANGIRDTKSLDEWKMSLLALADIGNIFGIPIIVSTSRPNGPNGPYIPDILALLPNAQIINRDGQINAWDDLAFQQAVRALNRRQIIVSGIVTEVCVAFLALSLQSEGYQTFAAIDSSGSYSKIAEEMGIIRMVQAGITPMTWFAIACELQVDWRNPTGAQFTDLVRMRLPFYTHLINSFDQAVATVQQPPPPPVK